MKLNSRTGPLFFTWVFTFFKDITTPMCTPKTKNTSFVEHEWAFKHFDHHTYKLRSQTPLLQTLLHIPGLFTSPWPSQHVFRPLSQVLPHSKTHLLLHATRSPWQTDATEIKTRTQIYPSFMLQDFSRSDPRVCWKLFIFCFATLHEIRYN